MKFIEAKKPNLERVSQLLKLSEDNNHWTNFGPVAGALESKLENRWGVEKVVMTSSGASALMSLVQFHNHIADKELKWVVSSFSFPCCIQGPLRDATIVDCDHNGMLDLYELPPQFDGMIVTNLFGLKHSIEMYNNYCEQHKKILIIDSAASYHTEKQFNEITSFHQTKPWGFGEGGCAIVEPEYERDFRSIINFGLVEGKHTGSWSWNAKMSDPAAAFIYDRLEQYKPIEYALQRLRVEEIAEEIGLNPIKDSNCGHVPILYPVPVNKNDLTQKYYRPLAPTPRATDLYRRMINFPCHPGLAEKSDDWINQALLDIAS